MKHKNIEILIQKTLDREINVQEKKLLHDHLMECTNCRQLYEEMTCSEQVHDLVEYYPRHDFNDRILKKLGFRTIFAWTKTAKVFAGAWLASILFLAFSPLPGKLLNQILTSAPAFARIVSKVEIIFSSLSHVILPFVRNSFDITWPVIGFVFSIIIIHLFSKAINPARDRRAKIEIPAQKQTFLTG